MTRTVRMVVDVLAYGAMCFAAAVLLCSWWLMGPRRKKEKGRHGR